MYAATRNMNNVSLFKAKRQIIGGRFIIVFIEPISTIDNMLEYFG